MLLGRCRRPLVKRFKFLAQYKIDTADQLAMLVGLIGLRKSFQDGTSKMAKRRCYGYTVNSDGELVINADEAL